MPDTPPLPESWAELIRLAIALVTGTLGTKLLDAWIRRSEVRSTKEEKERADEQAREDREDALRAQYERDYRVELRTENREIREALRGLEKKYNDCEDDRSLVRGELYLLRQQVQILRLRSGLEPLTDPPLTEPIPPGKSSLVEGEVVKVRK